MLCLKFTKTDKGTQIESWKDGQLVSRVRSKLDDEGTIKRTAKKLKVGFDDLLRAIGNFDRDGLTEYEIDAVQDEICHIDIRGIHASNTEASINVTNLIETLDQILSSPFTVDEPVIEWDNTKAISAVDFDSMAGYEWTVEKLDSLLTYFHPAPSYAWLTHGKGIRLIYTGSAEQPADQIAALALINLLEYPHDSLELKKITRHPLGLKESLTCGPVRKLNQTCDLRAINKNWLGKVEADSVEVSNWLTENGYEIGKKYDHDRCVINPTNTTAKLPVLVGDSGIKCFVCEAHGHQSAGFVPFSVLARSTRNESSHVSLLLANATHWCHAQHVLRKRFDCSLSILAKAYARAVHICHPNAERSWLNRVFLGGKNLLRLNKRWVTLHGETYDKHIGSLLSELPASRYKDDNISASAITTLSQIHDLTERGYPHLYPIRGLEIARGNPNYTIVFQSGALRDESKSQYRPRYLQPKDRDANAWKILNDCCPGLNHKLIKLLIAARGFAELGTGMAPMIFITGPTSAAKTSTISLAAAICGDTNSEVVVTDTSRTRQSILEGADRGSFVTFNEITKLEGRNAREVMDLLLNFTPNSLVHLMYVGPVPLGKLPVFCWTDTAVPNEVKADAQLARRLVHANLPNRVNWMDSLDCTIGNVDNLRLAGEIYATAASSILSEVIDDCFGSKHYTFLDYAAHLGFAPMEQSEERECTNETLKEFFEEVCSAPEISGTDLQRLKKGWRRIDRGANTPLSDLWDQLRDDTSVPASRRCSEVDWQQLMQKNEPIVFEMRATSHTTIFVRFRSASTNSKNHRFCGEIL